ncbi:hypothetical protein HPP92_023580 [Vanilla planifolia]|uniref:Uncharacterized protein n=1 Tax=Vanilla planifolia TaxID=51239 RepID=A0A835UEL2_VANPL|nr:hypothetical protein HPP92_023580 [Vanilla planifolia]
MRRWTRDSLSPLAPSMAREMQGGEGGGEEAGAASSFDTISSRCTNSELGGVPGRCTEQGSVGGLSSHSSSGGEGTGVGLQTAEAVRGDIVSGLDRPIHGEGGPRRPGCHRPRPVGGEARESKGVASTTPIDRKNESTARIVKSLRLRKVLHSCWGFALIHQPLAAWGLCLRR